MAGSEAHPDLDDLDVSSITDRAELSAALAVLRARQALSVRDVARLSGLPLATVGGYLAGRHLPQPATIDQFQRVLAALGVPDGEQGPWLEAVGRLRRAPGPRPASATAPYRGLAPYTVDDAHLFVGREGDAEALVARVLAEPASPVVVVGPSGVGKSSLLRAGLVASLRAAGHAAVVVASGADLLAAIEEATA
jgi:transcriptional regulator with XRE-family HTH domain